MDGWVSAAQAGPAMLKRFGLRARLVLLVLLAVAPVFALFAYSAAEHRRAIVERAQVNLQFQALLAALNQQRLVEGVAEVLSGVANARRSPPVAFGDTLPTGWGGDDVGFFRRDVDVHGGLLQ